MAVEKLSSPREIFRDKQWFPPLSNKRRLLYTKTAGHYICLAMTSLRGNVAVILSKFL